MQAVGVLYISEATLSPLCYIVGVGPSHDLLYSFLDYSTIFNGNVITAARAVVCPVDAEDVSRFVDRSSCINDQSAQISTRR